MGTRHHSPVTDEHLRSDSPRAKLLNSLLTASVVVPGSRRSSAFVSLRPKAPAVASRPFSEPPSVCCPLRFKKPLNWARHPRPRLRTAPRPREGRLLLPRLPLRDPRGALAQGKRPHGPATRSLLQPSPRLQPPGLLAHPHTRRARPSPRAGSPRSPASLPPGLHPWERAAGRLLPRCSLGALGSPREEAGETGRARPHALL